MGAITAAALDGQGTVPRTSNGSVKTSIRKEGSHLNVKKRKSYLNTASIYEFIQLENCKWLVIG